MIRFPFVKLNIGLHITEKRDDGFHNLESIFYPAALTDALEFVPAQQDSPLQLFGNEAGGAGQENLVNKAAKLLRSQYNVPSFDAALYKKIPAGAGLGGGSSDAAFTLMMLNDLFELNISGEELSRLALHLGSDCPFFIEGKPALATGRGEIFKPLPDFLKGYHWIIVFPGVSIDTANAYKNIIPNAGRPSLSGLTEQPFHEWEKLAVNDFEEYAFSIFPELKEIKTTLYEKGARFASMTGSGSAIYGIFDTAPPVNLPADNTWQVFRGQF